MKSVGHGFFRTREGRGGKRGEWPRKVSSLERNSGRNRARGRGKKKKVKMIELRSKGAGSRTGFLLAIWWAGGGDKGGKKGGGGVSNRIIQGSRRMLS